MFIGEESTREFLSRSTPLHGGFKSASEQLRDAWNSARYEDLSVSRASALYEQAENVMRSYEEKTGEKFGAENPYFYLGQFNGPVDIASDMWARYAALDWNARAPWSKWGKYEDTHAAFWSRMDEIGQKYPDLKTDEAGFMKNIAAKAENLRTKRDSGNLRAWGGLADFVGSTGGLMTDPVNLASMVFGGGGAAAGARSLLSRLMATASREAAIGAVAETAIQPQVMDFKRDIGVDYGVGDAVSNIAQAAVGGAVFGAGLDLVGAGVRPGIRGVRAHWQAMTDKFPELATQPGAQEAQSVIDDVIAAYDHSPFEETLAGNAAHEKAFSTATSQILQGKPVELRQVFEGLQRIPETKPVKMAVDETGKAAAGDAPLDGDDILDLGPGAAVLGREDLATMFDAGKEPPKPRDVLSVIKDMGGIKPEGETRAMDLHKVRPGLVSKAGKSFGEIREHLEEIGMLPEGSADNDVFDLIDDAVRGNGGGIYHPADFDRALEWEAWRKARDNADISREFAESLFDEAAKAGRALSRDEFDRVMRSTDPRSGDVPADVIKRLDQQQSAEPDFDPAQPADLSGRKPGFDINWARAVEMADNADDAATNARKQALRRTGGDIVPEDLAAIEAEARQQWNDFSQSRPAHGLGSDELQAEIERLFSGKDDDFTIVDPENFDADGNAVEVSAREFLQRSKEETEDAALIVQCMLNKVA